MLLVIAQIGLMYFWLVSLEPASLGVRAYHVRTIVMLGYGWFSAAHGIRPNTFPSLACESLVWIHVVGLCMAVWNRDSRIFRHRDIGLQDN